MGQFQPAGTTSTLQHISSCTGTLCSPCALFASRRTPHTAVFEVLAKKCQQPTANSQPEVHMPNTYTVLYAVRLVVGGFGVL